MSLFEENTKKYKEAQNEHINEQKSEWEVLNVFIFQIGADYKSIDSNLFATVLQLIENSSKPEKPITSSVEKIIKNSNEKIRIRDMIRITKLLVLREMLTSEWGVFQRKLYDKIIFMVGNGKFKSMAGLEPITANLKIPKHSAYDAKIIMEGLVAREEFIINLLSEKISETISFSTN